MQTIAKLIDREQKLKEQLKEVREELKDEVEKTEMFKAFLDAINETMPDKVPEKDGGGQCVQADTDDAGV